MGRQHQLLPSAASLTASMRDLGYSLETAIADLIDNSIFAGATEINIFCTVEGYANPLLVILDNGHGMCEPELISAMRHGSTSPKQQRSPKDLGRFGLGLKTASFSQCRSLTVASKGGGKVCGAEWNLDRIDKEDDWLLSILDETEINSLPYIDHLGPSGTAVIWQKLDRLVETSTGDRSQEIVNEKLMVVNHHLSLVFHRFLAGEIKGQAKISININGHAVKPFDPFCLKNRATQVLPEEIIRVGSSEVRLQPYILPHHSRLSVTEFDFYQDRSDFISNQGAYVYRNGRLMAWGDWFRLVPKGEATKLARVQIDFQNCLDEAWTIDIKKSRARPPIEVRERLRQIINQITGRSISVHRGRGKKLFQESQAPIWERYADHDGIRFSINDQHPIISSLKDQLTKEQCGLLNILIKSIAASIPIEMIYSDYSTSPRQINHEQLDERAIYESLQTLKQIFFSAHNFSVSAFLEILRSTHLYDKNFDLAEKLIREKF